MKREEEGNIHRLFNHQEDATKGLSANDLHTAMDVCRGVLAGPARTESGNQKSEIRNCLTPSPTFSPWDRGEYPEGGVDKKQKAKSKKQKSESRNQKSENTHPPPPSLRSSSTLSQGDRVSGNRKQFFHPSPLTPPPSGGLRGSSAPSGGLRGSAPSGGPFTNS